jgi:alpha-L-fucosidase
MKRLRKATFRGLAVLGVLAGTATHVPAESSPDPYANESREQRDERMAWWRDARFGMFIHWGVYAVPAGTYNGEQISGIGEWIMLRGKIPVNEYKAYAGQFNPVLYDPEAWAKLAKKAGMRYIVITSKHHDGFALFPSAVTDWDVVDATPYGKDLIGPLAEAARAEGLGFGLYYSQAQDWNHPGGAKSGYEEGEGWDELHKGDFDEYLDQIAIPQVGEILSRYRPDILWWDTPRWMTEERAERLIPLVRIVPGIILNNRLGGGYRGDTETPEQHIPATGFKDRDWEVCMTMNGTWGYKSYDHNWKSTEDLIHKLCDIVSKGGNFLLNVGPTAEGLIPQPSVERLEEIGAWMDVNGESIYGTTASPFHRLTWGRCTQKAHPGGTTLYLHVFDWPEDGRLFVPGLKSVPVSIRLLQDGKELAAEPVMGAEPGLAIMVPNAAPDPIASVIRLEVAGELDVDPILPRQSKDGGVELEPAFADLHNRLGSQLKLESKSRKTNIGYWTDARAWVGWTFHISQPGTFNVQAEMASEKDTTVTFGLSDQPKTEVALGATEGYDDFQARELGTLEIPAAGTYTLEIQPVKQDWNPINLRSVFLRPSK